MSTEILRKTDGNVTTVEATDTIVLDKAGVVRLQLGPEQVERFDRVGDDLRLVLKDGRTITIRNFFVVDEDGERHDLVLEDADEVLWWGQYSSPWSEFHFTEISADHVAALWLPDGAGLAAASAATASAASSWVLPVAALGGATLLSSVGGSDAPAPAPNQPPAAPGHSHAIDEDATATGRIVGSDPDGDTLTYRKGSDPSHGTVVVNPDGSYTYTPDPDFNGNDSFTVIVDDGNGGTTTSTVTITVNPVDDPVTAADDAYTTAEDTGIVLDLLANDSAPDGGLAITSINGVALTGGAQSIPVGSGTVEIGADGSMRFVPAADFNGTVSFPYEVRDADGDTDTATATIVVTPVNDAPVALVPPAPLDQVGVDAQSGVDVDLDPSSLFTDADGDALTYTVDGLPAGLAFDPATGRITGTIDPSASQGGPDRGGVHIVIVTATDPSGATATRTFTWTVTNPAPLATDDIVGTAEDTAVTGNVITGTTTGTGTPGSDADPDGDLLQVVSFVVDGDPTVHAAGATVVIPGCGTLVLNADGSYGFTPVADWNGTVPTITYTVSDGEGGQDTAELVITVTPVVDIADDSGLTGVDVPVTIDVDANDDFGNGDARITAVGGTAIAEGETVAVANGTVTLNPDGTLTFTPASGFSGTASYTYTVTSGGVSETATVTVQVIGTQTTTGTVSEAGLPDGSTAGIGNVVTGTLNLPAGWTVVPQVGTTDNGTWEVRADGTYTFTLTSRTDDVDGEVERNTFTYTIRDGAGDELTQAVVVTIVDDAPVIRPVGATGSLDVDESSLGTAASADFAALFDVEHGADGQGLPPAYALSIDAGVPSGLVDVATGAAVMLSLDGNTVTGTVGPGGPVVFTLTLDPDTGEATLQQLRALRHASGSDPDDVASLPAGAISITATATDADGDATDSTRGIGDLVRFRDDGPSIDTATGPSGSVQVDESALGVPSDWVDFSTLFQPADYGSDGAGSLVYSLEFEDAATGLFDTTTGNAISLVEVGGTLEGRVDGTGELAFTIEINAQGEVRLTQHRAVAHADGADPDDLVTLDPGTVVVRATVTDGDGDSASAAFGVGVAFQFRDDGPVVVAADDVTVDEQYLPTGSEGTPGPVVASGALEVDPGSDGVADIVFTVDTIASLPALTAGGESLFYVLDDGGHTLIATAGDGGPAVFTVAITNPTGANPGYTFTLHTALDNPAGADLTPQFLFRVIDGDGDHDEGSFTVTVVDDTPESGTRTVETDEDNAVTFNTSADGSPDNTAITVDPQYGTATVGANGEITYTPTGNYSGTDTFTYTITADDGSIVVITTTVTVNPVSDAPGLGPDRGVSGVEDSDIDLQLVLPVITDADDLNGPGAGDHGERLGAITLTLQDPSGGAETTGATLVRADGTPLEPNADGSYTIVVVTSGMDVDTSVHVSTGLPTGPTVNYLTQAEYEGLLARTGAEQHGNFRVQVQVTSYEVDDAGAPRAGVPGVEGTQIVDVGVQAVTDGIDLRIDVGSGPVDADTPAAAVDVPMAEDTAFNLATLLDVLLGDSDGRAGPDTDGSEERWFTITGLPEGTLVDGHAITADESANGYRIDIPGDYNGASPALPAINVTAPPDFSGTLYGIQVTLNARDRDSDGTDGTANTGSLVSDSVYVNLVVAPRAGDVAAGDVDTTEDMAVAFLQHVRVTDGGTAGGTEVIDSVSFELPAGWVLLPPASDGTWTITGTGGAGDPYIITFTGGTAAAREAVLDAFEVRPPAHSSADATVTVQVVSTDSNAATGAPDSTVTTSLPIRITVTPVGERTDGDSNDADGNDVSMTPGHIYGVSGKEDEWFALNTGGFDLGAGWSNEDGNGTGNGGPADGSEQTFARLTPFGADRAMLLEGSSFQYFDGSTWHVRVYNGTPVDIPLAYLDTLQFRGPLNFKGGVEIRVQAVTIDTDEDDSSVTNTQVSGEAWLSNLVLDPVADMVTLRVEARVVGNEDADIPLTVRPTSSDPSEDFNVTIRGIPAGATLSYDGQPVTLVPAGDGTFEAVIVGFDPGVALVLSPPADSNAPIRLEVDAVSVDGASVSPVATLPIDITVRGVPDAPVFTVDNDRSYVEADLDSADNTVALRDLVTELRSGETSADGSETVTLRISGLPEGFTLVGAGPVVGNPASAVDRVWVVTADQIANGTVRVQVPPNFSGTVSFTAQPVVTENDNPSELFGTPLNVGFEITPSPEATLNVSSTVAEDTTGRLDFSVVHRNGDTDETISEVRFRLAAGAPAATFFAADDTPLVADGDGWYTVTGDDIAGVQVRGPANFSGSIPLEVRYSVTDPGDGTVAPVTSGLVDTTHTIVVQPVTDAVEVEVDTIAIGSGAGTVDGGSVALDEPGTVTVNVDITKGGDPAAGGSPDHDGSEVLTHIVVTGVPDGVSVTGATFTGDGSWLIVLGEGFEGPIDQAIQFVVDGSVANLPPTTITITAYTRDGGADSVAGSTTWTLETAFGPGDGDGRLPTVTLATADTVQVEDEAFSLSEAVSAVLDTTGSNQGSYDLTVTLRTAPGDATSFDHPGMTRVEVMEGGVPVVLWMVTVTGVTDATAQAVLDAVLDAIQVHAPEHANRNNLDGPLGLDVTVTLYNAALRTEDGVQAPVDIVPVTDAAVVDIAAAPATEGQPVAITVNVTSPADQDDWSLVDGRLYLRLGTGMDGDLLHDGAVLTQVEVTGVPGLPDGLYYVIEDVQPGTPVPLAFRPAGEFDSGSITLDAWVRTLENGGNPAVSTGSQSLTVTPVNTPPGVTAAAEGTEHDGTTVTRVPIQLTGDVLADGDEVLASAFIEGLPADFTVFIGADAGSATLANNAGGGTWSIPLSGGSLPAYIAIQAPAHWSGTLPNVILYLVSGEDGAAPTAWPVPVVFTVAPQADGLALSPTLSFGSEGERIALNLNASLVDARAANGTDVHQERATVELSGFPDGALVRFFADGVELGPDRASYAGGTWTLTGLDQAELDSLQFIHSGSGDVAITVRAWTREYDADGNPVGAASAAVDGTVTINVADQLPTMGDDVLLWTGDAIDGRGGNDVVLLREGSLEGAELASRLRNIEELDLSSHGPNRIEDLTPEQARQILGVDGTLAITGTADDVLSLSGGWTRGAASDGYVEYTSAGGATLRVSEAIEVGGLPEAFTAGGGQPMPMAVHGADVFMPDGPLMGTPSPVPYHSPLDPLDDLLEPVQMIV